MDNQEKIKFEELAGRTVEADFSGGYLSSDGGLLILRDLDMSMGISQRMAACFSDSRNQDYVEHSLVDLLRQRIMGLCAGYEDLNDHNQLRIDPLLATVVGKADPLGNDRRHQEDKGKPLAGASTLNRLELGLEKGGEHYRKIQADHQKIENLIIDLAVETLDPDQKEVVLDFDATDDLIHGFQDGRFFHGYYGNYCYLPLYCFIGSVPIWAQLRSSDRDASDGTVAALEKIVPKIRARCPDAKIIVRADSGFCRETIMSWCENHDLYFCFGLSRNARLVDRIDWALAEARTQRCLTGVATRVFTQFNYKTRTSWSRERRVIAKAEILAKGENPRFVVTNLPQNGFMDEQTDRFCPQALYEVFYCARGDMENRIKEQQLYMFADRTSTHYMGSNQLRLWFSTIAYFLIERLRTLCLTGTSLAQASTQTIRLRLLKIAAQVTVSVRRVYVRFASACPFADIFALARAQLGILRI